MAIGKKLKGTQGEAYGTYHRIASIKLNFDWNQADVYLRHYADKNFRQLEKNEQSKLNKGIQACKTALKNDALTEQQKTEIMSNLQMLEAKNIASQALPHTGETKFSFTINQNNPDRETCYSQIMHLDAFKGAKEV